MSNRLPFLAAEIRRAHAAVQEAAKMADERTEPVDIWPDPQPLPGGFYD